MGVKQTATKRKVGRKPKFDYESDDFLAKVSVLAKRGYTDKEIARTIGLNESVFCEKKTEYPQLAEALQRARDEVNATVRGAFLKSALGGRSVKQYKYTESKCKCKGKNPSCEICKGTGWYVSSDERQVVETEMPANYAAQLRWMMNYDTDFRKRDRGENEESENNSVEGFDIEVTFNKKEDLELQEKVTKLKE